MSESHVVSGLVAKRSELAGLVEHHMQEIKRICVDLQHLDATIKLFAPELDLRTVRTKHYRKKNVYFKTGECARLVLDALRGNGGVMSTEAIALSLAAKKGLDTEDKDVTAFIKKATITALRHQANRKLVKTVGAAPDGLTLLWKLL